MSSIFHDLKIIESKLREKETILASIESNYKIDTYTPHFHHPGALVLTTERILFSMDSLIVEEFVEISLNNIDRISKVESEYPTVTNKVPKIEVYFSDKKETFAFVSNNENDVDNFYTQLKSFIKS